MKSATEIFVFKTDPEKREHTILVLKQLQQEIIDASRGGVKSVRTLISATDDVTISQIYEWDDIANAKRVFELFLDFENAKELKTLNKENIFMGHLLEVESNNFNV